VKTNLLRAAFFTPGPQGRWGLPLLLWGLPGVAKSAILRQIAAEYNVPIEVLSPAARGEGAFGVTPVPEGGRMTYPRPDWTDKFVEAGRGIVFVDEINLAATHFAGALLGLLQDRVLGSYRFGPGIRIFGAANPIDIAAASGGWDLSAPAANRVGHIDWPAPTAAEWSDWLLGEDGAVTEVADPVAEELRVMALWPEAWGRARGIVTGFLSAHGTHLCALPKNGSAETSKAWPSPRTWEMAARALASADVHDLTEAERDEFVGAFVGEGAAGEIMEWLRSANLPDSADLLDGKLKRPWTINKARLDVTMAVFGSAVSCVVGTTDAMLKKRRAEALWALLAQASESAPDLIVTPARVLVREKLFAGAIGVLGKLNSVLEAAKIQVAA